MAKNTVEAKEQLSKSRSVRTEHAEGKGYRVMFVGNSITLHGIRPEIGWYGERGMASSEPHIVSENHPMLKALMNAYTAFTGKSDATMQVNAGGTYAKHLHNAAEIGTSLGGGKPTFELPTGHGHVHQPDECISIDGLLKATQLTMLMLIECDKQHED